MRSLLTIGLLTCLAPSAALADALPERFAACTGRLSAQLEHQWLMGQPSQATEAQRSAMLSLLDAVVPPDQERTYLILQIDAKRAQAAILTRATFNDDPEDARWALRRAEDEVAHCTALLLS